MQLCCNGRVQLWGDTVSLHSARLTLAVTIKRTPSSQQKLTGGNNSDGINPLTEDVSRSALFSREIKIEKITEIALARVGIAKTVDLLRIHT